MDNAPKQFLNYKIQRKLQSAQLGSMTLAVEFSLEKGSFLALYGPSGAGKTSILRILAGLMEVEDGEIVVNGEKWLDIDQKINLPPQARKIAYLFQDYALFPNMTVRQNLEYALVKGQSKDIIQELVEIMELKGIQERYPKNLSGGQQQRVALARALVREPEILLLDEPLSALDMEMRSKLQDYILTIHKKYNLTTILVSHDLGEIFKLSNRVLRLEEGQIIKDGEPNVLIEGDEQYSLDGVFQVIGQVVYVEHTGGLVRVKLLINGQVKSFLMNEHEVEGFEVGDWLRVTVLRPFPYMELLMKGRS